MTQVLTLAWRNVWRNRRRSVVTMAAMALALWVMVLYAALVQGYMQSMERNLLDLEVGDIQISTPGYHIKPSLYEVMAESPRMVQRLRTSGFKASTRVLASALAASDDASAGVRLIGVDPDTATAATQQHAHVARGQWLSADHPRGVVLGAKVAVSLHATVGAELVVLTQAADGSVANELVAVVGVLKNIGASTDRSAMFMTESFFRQLMVLPEGVHQVVARRPEELNLTDAAAAASAAATGQAVRTWRQIMPTLAGVMDAQEAAMRVMFLICYLAIGIVILNAMLMAVFERIRELGVLKAVGLGPWTVAGLIVGETAIQTAIASAVGLVLSLPCLWYLTVHGINLGALGGIAIMGIAWDPVWRASVSASTFREPVVILVAVVALAVAYPATKASRLRPVDAIRHR